MQLAVGFSDSALQSNAELLANQLQLPIDNRHLPRVEVTPQGLALLFPGFSPLYADFDSAALVRRARSGKKQGLIQACKPGEGVKIVDATAGWGRDAALLASFGADVVMVERNPILACLLDDALQRMKLRATLRLVPGESEAYLEQLGSGELPQVIYLDPMHPERDKAALVKKDMQVLQAMLGADQDVRHLVTLARHYATERVVVKWPQKIAALLPPDYSVSGKTVRFDVYLSPRLKIE